MNVEIEILTPDKWREYQDIRLKGLKTDPTSFGASYSESIKHTEEYIREKLSNINRRDYVARVENKIVALAEYTLEIPENVKHIAKIHAVFVDPEYRRKGIAYKLLKKMLEDLHNNEFTSRIILSVNNENEASKNLYKKLSFSEFGLAEKEMKINGRYYDQLQMSLIFRDKL